MPDPVDIANQVDRVAAETGVSLRAARRQVINETARAVVRASPVRTGRLRASWFFSPTFPVAQRGPSSAGLSTAASAQRALTDLAASTGDISTLDQAEYFLNGTNYAKYVNARTQFLQRAISRAGTITNSAIRRIRTIQGRL